MASVKWIKICTDIFDDEKILLIESMPDADSIIVVWFKLLCLAGKQNNGGVFMLNDKIAYTDEMLATIFRKPLNTVRLALRTFVEFGMIEVINNTITIPNWEKHQSLDKLEKAKEMNRLRVAKHREKQKQLANAQTDCNVTVTKCNADRIEEDKDIDLDIDNNTPQGGAPKKPKEKKDDIYTSEFETIWALYPNKKGKNDALKHYIKARKDGVSVETIEKGIRDYATECKNKKIEKQFMKHGSTWFYGKGWEDEYDLTPPETTTKTYGANGIAINDKPSALDDIF